ncbi:hypothetical protein CR205_02910 [Alteribacter lacisalsi]|uniref:Glycosyltransferase family 1 protein n=1 Tax=Alteribacter lacisalsi TaxID=2045244 RepID=A0A2W0HKF5_9BACI|nr:glycosyltransferase [Alteribacter lacisalsi]PYZ97562.1 hypothetical protein CR205_02910 [Alteribacter lacisalsi]
MRILHAPTEIAGQMGQLCQGLSELGMQVKGYNWFHSYLAYAGETTDTDAFELAKMIEEITAWADVFHFHNGNTLLPQLLDLPMLKASGKKRVMHHWGNDVRTVAKVKKHNNYMLPPSYYSDSEIHRRLMLLKGVFDTCIIQDYEMMPYVKSYYKHIHVLPLACTLSRFPERLPSAQETKPKIVHAPTNREFKGSSFVETAFKKLEQAEHFSFRTVEKMSHAAALKSYEEADIVVDQLLCGTYGMLSVEAMAMGKVVVAYIRPDVKAQLPKTLPIVNAKPETLAEVLRELIRDPELRHETGRKSRAFVKEHHDARIVAEKLRLIYGQL